MQKISSINRTYSNPTQRAQQWKQRVVREDHTLSLPAASVKDLALVSQHSSQSISQVLPGPGSMLGQSDLALDLKSVCSASSTSRLSTGRTTARSSRSNRSNRSSARSTSSFGSFNSRCSNLTEAALNRIERLEQVHVWKLLFLADMPLNLTLFCSLCLKSARKESKPK
jgi:hypothetical protein